MTELQIQETYVKDFLTVRSDGLNYNWITANQVNRETHIIESELKKLEYNINYKLWLDSLFAKMIGG